MRVSIVNCVSTAAEMMKFSDQSLLRHAGHLNFDYIIVHWLASPEVNEYLHRLPQIVRDIGQPEGISVHLVEYHTNNDIGYVANLRAMMNAGFDYGFYLNEYAGLVNTDCYFGPNWLKNLVKHASPDFVVNSRHITRTKAPRPVHGIVTEDMGLPIPSEFKFAKFAAMYDELYEETLTRAKKDNYRDCATMPYLFHQKYWEECGPWEMECVDGQPPDVRFFDRIAAAGAEYGVANDSIIYHHEAVERRGKRPPGAEHLGE